MQNVNVRTLSSLHIAARTVVNYVVDFTELSGDIQS